MWIGTTSIALMASSSQTRGRRSGQTDPLTTADLVVLSLLLERPMHGYDLLSEYRRQEVEDWASISKAQLYYALKKLAGFALLEAEADDGAARDRAVYHVTDAGIHALRAGLGADAWSRSRQAQPFTTWFGLSVHADPADRQRLLNGRLVFLTEEIAKERQSLAFIETLEDERARAGAEIVRLILRQLEVEREWVHGLLTPPK